MSKPMDSSHKIIMESAQAMAQIENQSIDLVVTSPPYPMIQLWDEPFCNAVPGLDRLLSEGSTHKAFDLMHRYLDDVWKEVARVLKPGAIACINIGDATRTFDGHFQLFANHARIITSFLGLGFSQLPSILWRKPTNAPNKFMGSGMYPPGAYVTLEHEYILIFRKGRKREFNDEALKKIRRESAYFWEERNTWFSDIWTDLRGVTQALKKKTGRDRSGAFPLELPFRLINMFSIKGDCILDPFLGTGTTLQAAMCAGRDAIGYEIDPHFHSLILENIASVPGIANHLVQERLKAHSKFINHRVQSKGDVKHQNRPYGFAVMTRQEEDLHLNLIQNIQYLSGHRFKVIYSGLEGTPQSPPSSSPKHPVDESPHAQKGRQLKLF